jgi:cell division septation protein DedD
MARFSFGKRTTDDEGIPPEPVEGEAETQASFEPAESVGKPRRLLVIAGIGVILIGGLYLANILFFSTPPAPTVARQAAPAPPIATPASPAPAKEAMPPVAGPGKVEVKTDAKAPTPAKAAPEAKPAAKAPAPAERMPPAKSGVPAGTPDAKTTSKEPPKTSKGFSVQVGAMAQAENAEALKRKLDALGYQAAVRKGSGFAPKHVVTVGEPVARREAEELARRLNVDGFPSQLATVEGKYTPQIGSFVNLDEAIDLARELQKKNYRPKITSSNTPATTVLFQVRHGQFDTRAAAVKRGEELKAKGFTAWVVPN